MTSKSISIGGRQEVNPREVFLFQADINYTIVYFKNGQKSIVATPLKSLEARFSSHNFFRTHKSYLVNLDSVKCFLQATNMVQLINDKKVAVSRRKRVGLKRFIEA